MQPVDRLACDRHVLLRLSVANRRSRPLLFLLFLLSDLHPSSYRIMASTDAGTATRSAKDLEKELEVSHADSYNGRR